MNNPAAAKQLLTNASSSKPRRNVIISSVIGALVIIVVLIYLIVAANSLPSDAQNALQFSANQWTATYVSDYYVARNQHASINPGQISWNTTSTQKVQYPQQYTGATEAWCVVVTFQDPSGQSINVDFIVAKSMVYGTWGADAQPNQELQRIGCTIGSPSDSQMD